MYYSYFYLIFCFLWNIYLCSVFQLEVKLQTENICSARVNQKSSKAHQNNVSRDSAIQLLSNEKHLPKTSSR